jgi:hypothetical protein
MKESHNEGLASHDGPESCAGTRESAGEALIGESTGGVLSREIRCNQGADAVELSGRQNTGARNGEGTSDPCAVEDLQHVRKFHAREPGDPVSAS